jgi:hypothetical protein
MGSLVIMIAIHALPTAVSSEVATIDPNNELAVRAIPQWLGTSSKIFAYNADVYLKVGACVSTLCYQAGDVQEAKGVGIAFAILYGIASIGKSLLPADYRPSGPARRGESTDYERFVGLIEDGDATDDLPLLLDFHDKIQDQVTLHTKWTNIEMTRLSVMHPVKRSMENIIRVRIPPGDLSKRQEGFYGMEAFFQEQSDYGYPPDRGWVGETANAIGQGINERQTEGNMCMKMVNYDGATSYTYIRYDGTPDDETYDNVFGCDYANYDV